MERINIQIRRGGNVYLVILLLAFFSLQGSVTVVSAQTAGQIKIIARVDSNRQTVKLRWAATTPLAWNVGNKYGYTLLRYTVLRDGKMIENPIMKILGKNIKPKPVNEWQKILDTNNNAAVVAQAIYGEDFEVTPQQKTGANKILNKSQELEQRFGFSLYAADRSFDAALLAGWAFEDTAIQKNEKYFYKIITGAPQKVLPKDSSGVYIGWEDYNPLPVVADIAVQFGNKTVAFMWSYEQYADFYNGYYIEKSEDGGNTFSLISDIPLTNMNDENGKPTNRIYFIDSLKENNKEYFYRILGTNSFGEKGQPSALIKGMGEEMLEYVPNISKGYIDEKNQLHLFWDFSEQGNSSIEKFVIEKNDEEQRDVYTLFEDHISPNKRSITSTKSVENTSYFTITAIAKQGKSRTSFPFLIQKIDSVPPAIPNGVTATIDTSGVVTIKWNQNTEKDLKGYKVFRALKQGEEMIPITDSVYYQNQLKDTLSQHLLNKKAWYAVVALDNRLNQSEKSDTIELKKITKIPPTPAVIRNVLYKDNAVELKWINSTDDDIKDTHIYRSENNSQFEIIKSIRDTASNTFTDVNIKPNKQYYYFMEVVNTDYLSTFSDTVRVSSFTFNTKPQINRFYVQSEPRQQRIKLVWDDNLGDNVKYHIYRADENNKLTLWKITYNKGILDTNVIPGTTYQYAVMAELPNGTYSQMKTEKILY